MRERRHGAQNTAEILLAHGIPLETWGTGKAKTLQDLEAELRGGESRLAVIKGKLVRDVRTLAIAVFYTGLDGTYMLREDRQVFDDGRERRRTWMERSLAEKIHEGEGPTDAARRALKEELGIAEDLGMHPDGERREERMSNSFPGLMSRFELFLFSTEIPDSSFRQEGYVEKRNGKTTYFVWEKLPLNGGNRT